MNLLSGSSPSFFEPNTTGPAGSVRSETAVLAFRVLPTDFDLNLHMNNARSLSPMDLGRVDLLNRLGLLRLAFRGHWVPVLGDVSIRYHRPLELWQRASLPTRILAGVGRVGATAGSVKSGRADGQGSGRAEACGGLLSGLSFDLHAPGPWY